VRFQLTVDDLKFYNEKLQHIYEPGDFKVYIGGSSADVKEAGFKLLPG
jgi:beta-glucosidase